MDTGENKKAKISEDIQWRDSMAETGGCGEAEAAPSLPFIWKNSDSDFSVSLLGKPKDKARDRELQWGEQELWRGWQRGQPF